MTADKGHSVKLSPDCADGEDHEYCDPFHHPDCPCECHWEQCEECGHEFRYPHLCREHHLCGLCHPPIDAP